MSFPIRSIPALAGALALPLAMLVLAAPVWAQGPNDVGAPAQNGPSLGPGQPAPIGITCPPAGVVSTAFTGATSQLGRVFRDAIPSACPSKIYPGLFNAATTYNYETFTYTNTSGATACVTVNFDPNTGPGTVCGINAHASAYLGSYNPAAQATNYVGDVGSSITQPFSFDVPPGQDLVLVVTNTASQALCGFSFQVIGLPCSPLVFYCFGDGSSTACPCANTGAAGNGCRNSAVMAGANLAASGVSSLMSPSIVLTATGMPANKPCFFYQGTTQQSGGAGIVFGDGKRCAGGIPVLLGYRTTTGGMAVLPSGMGPQIPVVGGIMAPGTRTYQVTYYDTAVFCTPSFFNHTNGVEVVWTM